jgi:hypothetical protein
MRNLIIHLILTLVVSSYCTYESKASPNDQIPLPSITEKAKKDSKEPLVLEPTKTRSMTSYSTELRFVSAVFEKSQNRINAGHLLLEKSWHQTAERSLGASLGMSYSNLIMIEALHRDQCCHFLEFNGLNSYYDFHLALLLDAKDQLANFIDYQKFFLGSRWLWQHQNSWGFTTGLSVGYLGFQFSLGLRYLL